MGSTPMSSLGSYPPLKMGSVPVLALGSTGRSIPQLGYGTADFPFGANSETMKESILHAIKIGYRHFDTAANYQSEQPLREAIAEALRLGFIQSRDELFITSKLWCSDAHPDLVLPALRKSLGSIGVDYLDLYLIHFPVSMKPGSFEEPFKDILPLDFKAVWEKMEECQRIGLTKSIGVSNFSCKKLENLLATAKIPPTVNQVEMNPKWQQKKLRELCDRKNILIVAYSPLGARGTPWQSNLVTECEVLKEIATANGKTVAQVCLRWLCEQGVGVVVKSFNKERIKENFDIFSWELKQEDVYKISQTPQQRGYLAQNFISDDAPYKSVEEFWDGEI